MKFDEINESLFGVLDKKYCNLFYFMMVFGFVGLFLTAGGLIYGAAVSGSFNPIQFVLIMLQPVFLYLITRVQYSMCMRAL